MSNQPNLSQPVSVSYGQPMGQGPEVPVSGSTYEQTKKKFINHHKNKQKKYNNLAKGLMGISLIALLGGLTAAVVTTVAMPATGMAVVGYGIAAGVGGGSQVLAGISKLKSMFHRKNVNDATYTRGKLAKVKKFNLP